MGGELIYDFTYLLISVKLFKNVVNIEKFAFFRALQGGCQEFKSLNTHHIKRVLILSFLMRLSCIRDFEKKYRKFDILVGSFYKKFSLII